MAKSTISNQARIPLWQPLKIRNFLLLFVGENISLLGDQLYLVALPWLTLQLTNSGLSLGTVLMAAAIPRAILLLVGGVVNDRISPRFVMLFTNSLRALLTIALTLIVWDQTIQLWHLYLFSICFGSLDGFFIPAIQSIVPRLVKKEQLTASNTLSQGTNQLILLIGPALAGIVIALSGIKVAFAIDAVTFIFSAITLSLMQVSFQSCSAQIGKNQTTDYDLNPRLNQRIFYLFTDIREGLEFAWHNLGLRTLFLVLMVYNFVFIGPLRVGFASLAHSRFLGGAVALGILNSAWGGGNLLGSLMPSLLSKLPRLGALLLILGGIQGSSLLLLGFVPNLLLASIVIVLLGCCSGCFIVTEITWVQKQTPPEMLGRVTSLGLLSSFGIAPFSFALAGVLADANLTALFSVTGSMILLMIVGLAVNRSVRQIE